MNVYPVVLAGGRGTRLWPLSRADKPKQFLEIHGDHSLFQQTLARHRSMAGMGAPWVVCGGADRFEVEDGLEGIGLAAGGVILEPVARNTGPAIAAAAYALALQDPEALLLVLPSDHLVTPDAGYFQTLAAGFDEARRGKMVTFGIVPSHPETGFGYIAVAQGASDLAARNAVLPVERFVEKPALEEAERMLATGGHFWNAGFFAFSAKALLSELERIAPQVVSAARDAVNGAARTGHTISLDAKSYGASPDISIDYALFERTDQAMVAPIACPWSDVGSWRAYRETLPLDDAGNAIRGRGLAVDSANSLIVSPERDVVALGVEGMAVIAATDAVLVCPLDRAQDVRLVTTTLRDIGRSDLLDVSPTVSRPWGGYTSIMNGDRFQVKHLFVTPGKSLSLQKHYHRAEHWVVVRGTAEVTIDDRVITLSENQSTYLPQGCIHRLANPGKIMLEVIEVQTGSYLREDDIIRLADDWNRTSD